MKIKKNIFAYCFVIFLLFLFFNCKHKELTNFEKYTFFIDKIVPGVQYEKYKAKDDIITLRKYNNIKLSQKSLFNTRSLAGKEIMIVDKNNDDSYFLVNRPVLGKKSFVDFFAISIDEEYIELSKYVPNHKYILKENGNNVLVIDDEKYRKLYNTIEFFYSHENKTRSRYYMIGNSDNEIDLTEMEKEVDLKEYTFRIVAFQEDEMKNPF